MEARTRARAHTHTHTHTRPLKAAPPHGPALMFTNSSKREPTCAERWYVPAPRRIKDWLLSWLMIPLVFIAFTGIICMNFTSLLNNPFTVLNKTEIGWEGVWFIRARVLVKKKKKKKSLSQCLNCVRMVRVFNYIKSKGKINVKKNNFSILIIVGVLFWNSQRRTRHYFVFCKEK